MRELKFRVWDLDEDLPEGDCRMWDDSENLLINFKARDVGVGEYGNVLDFEDCIIMQFTGARDINKKEIYEGDILTSEDGSYEGEVFWDEGEMCYMCGHKNYAQTDLAQDDIFKDAKVKIIGNIYKNLESKDDANHAKGEQ